MEPKPDVDEPAELEPIGIREVRRAGFRGFKNIVVLTGAGTSVASGIPPFRGPGGLWNDPQIERFAHREILDTDPMAAWTFFGALRETARSAKPNAAHDALVRFENGLRSGQRFLLITQNVDGLHQRAGSRSMVELHGSVLRTRCSNYECTMAPYADDETHSRVLPVCPVCGSVLRPALVFFGELCNPAVDHEVKKALRDCDLFISVGTSGTVSPANGLVRSAQYAGALTIYINLEAMDPPNPYFQETILGKAEDVLPGLFP
jgi:NAD-dependent deacetylase